MTVFYNCDVCVEWDIKPYSNLCQGIASSRIHSNYIIYYSLHQSINQHALLT